ncbi:S41 family peptidase [Robertkochia solimangrovi]|uniref:S41 family peptidase n=1 Tax=Robertkochia solimangrovi TaxID=2213046 RepID=UPI00117E1D95|nr:S41 family peptidase [Robertkochia solimangrovi]TRZ41815.1 peptidase S41 [Robertkochia solimangrovi]
MTNLRCMLVLCFSVWMATAQENAKWLRYPSVSPDGSTIVFGYMGNLYRVASQGGNATAITSGDAYDSRPVWSHDGKTLAFASDRYGNFDVYSMPATGGMPIRLTFNSVADYPYDFTADNKHVLFGSSRYAPAESVRFPSSLFRNLYTVPVEGGRPILLTAAGADLARYDSKGDRIVFQDRKGYEDEFRKHHTSAVTRDIWIYDIKGDSYRQVSTFAGENREPVFNHAGTAVYYLNEKDGTQNLYKLDLSSGSESQLTTFSDFPVRNLSVSDGDKLVFTWKGEIYSLTEGSQPVKLDIQVFDDAAFQVLKNRDINSVTEFELSPNGKEIAFVNRGEVFVTGVEDARTKRLTNTPEQERMISWAPDGKTLLFSTERGNSWDVYKATLERPDEKYFYASTLVKTEPVLDSPAEEFQAAYSPDGKKIAYVEERNILKVMDVASGNKVTLLPEGHNHSYSDGDWGYRWSPDSKWLILDDQKGYFFINNVALISADGKGEIRYPVNSGFGEGNAQWGMEGKMMTYETSRNGRKSLAIQGSTETDIYAVFFDKEAYDKYILSEEDFKLMEELEKDKENDKKEAEKDSGKNKGKDKDKKEEDVKPLQIDLENIDYRKVKLTINSSSISGYVLSKDGSKLYYLTSFEKGYDLWETEPRTKKTKILAKLGGSPSGIEISKDGKYLLLSNRGRLVKVDVNSGKMESIGINGDMVVDAASERAYMLDHAWRQVAKKFYDPTIHGIDWDMYHAEYSKFLPYINNNYDFQELLSEFLGELNASHTGGRYYASSEGGDSSASLGLLFDEKYKGAGIKVTEVLAGGPLDTAEEKVKAGDLIVNIDGKDIEAGDNWNKYLNNITGKNVYLKIRRGKDYIETVVKPEPYGSANELLYRRWVKIMEDKVDALSGGKLGYVHVRGMNDGSFREVYDKAMGRNRGKEALVVDTRFNGGGWLHDDLNTFLTGKEYLKFAPQGNVLKGGESMARWTKPSIVIMSESNYSDAHIFPYIYKQNGIGKLVGTPVAGTGTAVWWERQIDPSIIFGIPMVATIGKEGRPTENLDLVPDILVPLDFSSFLKGEDPQLKAAVEELMK